MSEVGETKKRGRLEEEKWRGERKRDRLTYKGEGRKWGKRGLLEKVVG